MGGGDLMTNEEARRLAALTHSLRRCQRVAVQHCHCGYLHKQTIAKIDAVGGEEEA